jgi:hypothetical protein
MAEERPAEDVQVTVLLALHRVVTEVGEKPKASGAHPLADIRGNAANVANVVFPEFGLRGVLLRHCEEHYRHPTEDVLDNDDLVILVDDVCWLTPGYNVAKDAVGTHSACR